MISTKNIGQFEVQQSFIKDDPELVAEIFSRLKVVPVRCEVLFWRDVIRYEAISENFEEVPEAAMIPEYVIEISWNKNNQLIHVEFKKHGGVTVTDILGQIKMSTGG